MSKHNNPAAHRFEQNEFTPIKKETGFERIAYVLQGGGSLGAYQMGTLKGLFEAGYEPDWIAATSIGAVLGAIVAGNNLQNRIPKLEEFWRRVATYTPFDILGESESTRNIYNQIVTNMAMLWGQRDFFSPRWVSPYCQMHSTPDKLSLYDTSLLKQTLLDLVDFDLLNNSQTRLSLAAVQVRTGRLIYFNNINYLIGPEHIMASAALPPGFPAVQINGEYYWDGGLHSNTPLEVILDASPGADTLCFVIDCFGGTPFIPTTMEGVGERSKDIRYSTHAHSNIKHYVEKQRLQIKLQKISKYLTEEQLKPVLDMMKDETPKHHTLVHITHKTRLHKGESKDYNFGQVIIKKRIDRGYKDALALLEESEKWNKRPEALECRFHEAPNNEKTSPLHYLE